MGAVGGLTTTAAGGGGATTAAGAVAAVLPAAGVLTGAVGLTEGVVVGVDGVTTAVLPLVPPPVVCCDVLLSAAPVLLGALVAAPAEPFRVPLLVLLLLDVSGGCTGPAGAVDGPDVLPADGVVLPADPPVAAPAGGTGAVTTAAGEGEGFCTVACTSNTTESDAVPCVVVMSSCAEKLPGGSWTVAISPSAVVLNPADPVTVHVYDCISLPSSADDLDPSNFTLAPVGPVA